mgnify:CR=1 FL=1
MNLFNYRSVIRRKIAGGGILILLMLATGQVFAQSKAVSGTVKSQQGEPLTGVTILIEGTTQGTSTDAQGAFTLQAKPDDMLAVSYLGYKTEKIPVGSKTRIDVTLREDTAEIEGVMVVAYGTAKKESFTGSAAVIKSDEIAKVQSSNVATALVGRVAGVQITNSGRAGQDPEIRIRGTNSINGFAPLYVVDGMFTDNINYLNANDIESFEILKDPSSLAIFGVRGANGVIIVTTKRAKMGQTVVNVNQSVGVKHVGHRMSLTNGPQFKELYNEQLSNMGGDPFDYTYYQANTDW